MEARKVKLDALVLPDPELWGRSGLNRDAVDRYKELFRAGRSRPVAVQAGTNRLIDGVHRVTAAKELGLAEIPAVEHEVADHDLMALAYRLNRSHGVPYSREERDRIIARLYFEDGWTQSRIAELTGLSQQAISKILSAVGATAGGSGDKRFRLKDEDMPAVARLLLAGATHEEVAQRFGVGRSTVTERWNEFREAILQSYREGALKQEVAGRFGLEIEEIDSILAQFGDPVNFTPAGGSLWAGFQIDERFGRRHPGNLPAALVRNLFYYYTKPGDLIVDPFAGGGVTLDVARDMVGRTCLAFDLAPTRPDIRRWDILAGPPPLPRPPDVVFLDPPWGPMKAGEYFPHPSQLADMEVGEFLAAMERVFGYWEAGRLILVMGCLRKEGRFVALPHECAKLMEKAGWRIIDWLANELHRPASENALTVAMEKERRVPRRTHVDIIVAEK